MKLHRLVTIALVAVLATGLAPSAHAQFGGLKDKLKKKAAEAVGLKKPDAPAPVADLASPGAEDSWLLPLNDTNLTRFEKGGDSLKIVSAQSKKALASIKTDEEYQKCMMTLSNTASGKAAFEKLDAAKTPEETQAAMLQLQRAQHEHCGYTQNDADYIESLQSQPITTAARVAGMTEQQFRIMLERMVPFYAKGGLTADKTKAFKIANGGGLFYTYTSEEVAALQAHAATIQPLLKLLV